MAANPFDQFDAPAAKTSNPQDFAKAYGAAAEKAGKALGVEPSVILGQWGLETGWGKSIIPGTNNLGNIKDFAGGGVGATDNMTGSKDKYRKYGSVDEFADDFTDLISRKYKGAVGAKTPEDFAKALKAGGYAEDPRYVDKVVQASRIAGTKPNPVMAAAGRVADAVIPSAQAAEPNPFDQFDGTPAAPASSAAEPASSEPGFAEKAYKTALQVMPGGGVLRMLSSGNPLTDAKNTAGGAVRGAGSIGATILAPVDMAQDAMAGKGVSLESNRARRAAMDSGLQELGADPNSGMYQGLKLGAEVAGTAGIGNVLGAGAQAVGAAPKVVNALRSGGMTLGGAPAKTVIEGAGNLALRSGAGAAVGGASAGLVNPDDALRGAVIGGSVPVVANVLTQGDKAIGNKLAENFAERTAAFGRGSEKNKTLQDGIQAGYVVPPSSVEPSLRNTVKESIGGKIATAQVASNRNQDVTDKLVRKSLGLADDAPLSAEALSKYRTDLHASGYEPLRQVGMIKADAKFGSDLGDVVQQYTGKGTIPATQKTEIADLVKAHQSGGFDSGDAVDAIRVLREDAKDAFRKGDSALGKAQRAIADAYEGALERSLPAGSPLLKEYQAARQNIAKSFTVEDALKEGTGAVDARKLAAALQKGTPLSGELLTVARFASAFPKATQPPSVVAGPGVHNLKAGLAAGSAAAGAAMFGPVGAAAGAAYPFVAPPLMRAQMFSKGAQNALVQQAPQANRLLQYSGNPNVNQLIYRAAPVIGSSGSQ